MQPQESHDLNERLGTALRALIGAIAHEEMLKRAEEIEELITAIGGDLSQEAEGLKRHLQSLVEISKKVTDSAFKLEQETREI